MLSKSCSCFIAIGFIIIFFSSNANIFWSSCNFWRHKKDFRFNLLTITWALRFFFHDQLLQIHTLGDAFSCRGDNWSDLDFGGIRFIRSHLTWPASSQRAPHNRNKRWKGVSNVCTRLNTNLCSGFELYQLLRSMYRPRRNLLQVIQCQFLGICNHPRRFISAYYLPIKYNLSTQIHSTLFADYTAMHRSMFDRFGL